MHLVCFLIVFISAAEFARPASIAVSNQELECYSNEKVYHENSGKCYKLLTKGPCQEGEWLVLDRSRGAGVNPICARERCPEGEYFWPATQSCVGSKERVRLCGESEEFVNNVFGEAECDCVTEPARARLNGDKRNPCHLLYSRGPCPAGKVLVLPEDEDTAAVCIEDPCHEDIVRRNKTGTVSADDAFALHDDGTCYELGTTGPCPEGLTFKVFFGTMKPGCTPLVTHIFGGVKQCSVTDDNGDCQKQVNKKKGNKYLKELQQQLKKI